MGGEVTRSQEAGRRCSFIQEEDTSYSSFSRTFGRELEEYR